MTTRLRRLSCGVWLRPSVRLRLTKYGDWEGELPISNHSDLPVSYKLKALGPRHNIHLVSAVGAVGQVSGMFDFQDQKTTFFLFSVLPDELLVVRIWVADAIVDAIAFHLVVGDERVPIACYRTVHVDPLHLEHLELDGGDADEEQQPIDETQPMSPKQFMSPIMASALLSPKTEKVKMTCESRDRLKQMLSASIRPIVADVLERMAELSLYGQTTHESPTMSPPIAADDDALVTLVHEKLTALLSKTPVVTGVVFSPTSLVI